jgi:quercetin dioxygenase-like cupin family protein
METWEPEDGPLAEKRLMGLLEREGYEVGVYTYREGTVFEEHEHPQDKCDAVLEGFFRVQVGDALFEMKPGDRLYIPAGTRHRAEVVGRRTVVSLDGTRW